MYWYFWGYMSISKLWHGWWLNVFEWITKIDIATSAASCRLICDFLTKNAQIDIMIERWRCYTQITSCLTMNNLQIFWLLVFKMLGGFWIILVWCWLPDVSFWGMFRGSKICDFFPVTRNRTTTRKGVVARWFKAKNDKFTEKSEVNFLKIHIVDF